MKSLTLLLFALLAVVASVCGMPPQCPPTVDKQKGLGYPILQLHAAGRSQTPYESTDSAWPNQYQNQYQDQYQGQYQGSYY